MQRVDPSTRPRFEVSRETRRALERGHPWILPDAHSDDPARFAPGTEVELRCEGQILGIAVTDDAEPAAARLLARSGEPAPLALRLQRAFERREALFASEDTDVFRLVHGEADGVPGVAVDLLGSIVRVLASSRAALAGLDALRPHLVELTAARLGREPCVIEVARPRNRTGGATGRVRCTHGAPGAGPWLVRERGLVFEVDPGLSEPERPRPGFGLFPDQRVNRARVARLGRGGGGWLNLFAHTGAFSAVLLAGGAGSVCSVDLSGSYLRWLERNLGRNGLHDERHRSVRREGRRFLGELGADVRFDGIVIDPPTAAASGRRFFSVERDLEPLVSAALVHLAPGGHLLVSRNDRRGRGRLEALAARAAASAGVEICDVQNAPAGPDFPRLRAFPEGDPMHAALLRRATSDGRETLVR